MAPLLRIGFPMTEDPKKRNLISCICDSVWYLSGTTFIFALYRPQDDGPALFDRISEKVYNIQTEFVVTSLFTTNSG